MSSLCHCDPSTDYVDTPGADDFVHANLLKETVNDEICCCINAIIDRLDLLTRDDDALKDNLILARMLAPEVKDLLPGFGIYAEARVATTTFAPLAGIVTIDGVLLQDGDLVLVKDQADKRENGVYRASAGLWIRIDDLADDTVLTEPVHVWVESGTQNLYSSWMINASSDAPVTISPTGSEIEWVKFHQEYVPTLDADIVAALAGTEGDPSAANLFVTNDDPRLDQFGDTQNGLVPQPGATSTCTRFLCEDGTWSEPAAATIANAMVLNAENIMTADGEITFPSTIGIHGLIDPADDDDAANKGYVDALFTSIDGALTDLSDWKGDLDGLTGLIACDGAGTYSAVALVASSFTDDSTYGGGSQTIAASIDGLNALIAANAGNIATNVGNIASNAGNISSLQSFQSTLDGLAGVIMCDGSGNYSAAALTASTNDYLAGDGTFQALPAALVKEYGELYGDDATTLAVQNTWYTIGGSWFTGLTNNFSASGGDTLNYNGSGTVSRLVAHLSGISATSAGPYTVEFAAFVNGTIVAKSTIALSDVGSGNVDDAAITCLLSLATSDAVTLRARCTSAASVGLIVSNINFNLYD